MTKQKHLFKSLEALKNQADFLNLLSINQHQVTLLKQHCRTHLDGCDPALFMMAHHKLRCINGVHNAPQYVSRVVKYNKKSFQQLTAFFMRQGDYKDLQEI